MVNLKTKDISSLQTTHIPGSSTERSQRDPESSTLTRAANRRANIWRSGWSVVLTPWERWFMFPYGNACLYMGRGLDSWNFQKSVNKQKSFPLEITVLDLNILIPNYGMFSCFYGFSFILIIYPVQSVMSYLIKKIISYLFTGTLSISTGNSNTASAVKINVLLFLCCCLF